MKKKILFFSHTVTMAHLGRPLKWIDSLDPHEYDIFFCSDNSNRKIVESKGIHFIEAAGIDPHVFTERIDSGKTIYSAKIFQSHVDKDLEIIQAILPDLVIGDFRHSLSVSCRILRVKYINITNAYWSPDITIPMPLPESPLVGFLGYRLTNYIWLIFHKLILFVIFFHMAWVVRKSLRLANLICFDYRKIMIDGDSVAFSDLPELIPISTMKINHFYTGPVIWSATSIRPTWWSNLNPGRLKVWVGLGSSGKVDVIPKIISSLLKHNFDILIATSGKKIEIKEHQQIFITDFMPIEDAFSICDFVICNGGSPIVNAALSFGRPVVGLVSNNDQVLNMAHVSSQNAGILLRNWNLSEKEIDKAINQLINEPKYRIAAMRLGDLIRSIDFPDRIRKLIKHELHSS